MNWKKSFKRISIRDILESFNRNSIDSSGSHIRMYIIYKIYIYIYININKNFNVS